MWLLINFNYCFIFLYNRTKLYNQYPNQYFICKVWENLPLLLYEAIKLKVTDISVSLPNQAPLVKLPEFSSVINHYLSILHYN